MRKEQRYRLERDSLGEMKVPADVYYGIQTLRALENFPVSGMKEEPEFIRAYVILKKAAALTNMELGEISPEIGKAIVKACDTILAHNEKFFPHFVVDVFQAGAGTSFNMNVNEVIANLALEMEGKEKGDYKTISPNDHVNRGQSTNDSFPTASHLAILFSLQDFFPVLKETYQMFYKKAEEFKDVVKSGRTHLQDAVPITLGMEFHAYGKAVEVCYKEIKRKVSLLEELAIGGSAAGTGMNTHPEYRNRIIHWLKKETGFQLREAEDLCYAMQSRYGMTSLSSELKNLSLELIRIANDLRLLSSGPTTGLSEISLPAVQPGSSIMPGKVNPVMAECLNMVAFEIVGNNETVSMASQAGQLELNVMMPVMVYKILQSLKLLKNFLPVFNEKCLKGIKANEKRCLSYLEKNPSLATFLTPYIGYLKASEIAKYALERGQSVKELVIEMGVLDKETVKRIFQKEYLLGKKKA